VNLWFRQHLGIRLEIRDHISPQEPGAHLWQARIGLAF
jgi:hypothetical protein